MQYRTWIGLLGAALSVVMLVIPTSAAPIVDATSQTHELSEAQPNAQPQTVQPLHIAVIGEVQRPGAYFLAQTEITGFHGHIYFDTADTERLILRPQQPSDYESWHAGFSGRLPKQHKYDEGQVSLEECDRQWFADLCQRHQQLALNDQVYVFGIFSRQNNQHLGHIDISSIRREDNQWASLGYGIHNQHWRQGFGKEAVRSALISGFEILGYHRIEAFINLDNQASIALAQSVGMQKECIRRGFVYENEQWVDHFIYVALPSDLGLTEKPPMIAIEKDN